MRKIIILFVNFYLIIKFQYKTMTFFIIVHLTIKLFYKTTILFINFYRTIKFALIFTTLLLGCSRSGVPFWDVFSIQVVLSFGAVLRLSNITLGRSEARVVGRNTRWKRDNKKNFKNHIISSIITSKEFLSIKIRKF